MSDPMTPRDGPAATTNGDGNATAAAPAVQEQQPPRDQPRRPEAEQQQNQEHEQPPDATSQTGTLSSSPDRAAETNSLPPPLGTSAAVARTRANDAMLSRLDLSGLYLTEAVLGDLADALYGNTHVRVVDLSRNDFEPSSPALLALIRLFAARADTLRVAELSLAHNPRLDGTIGAALIEAAKVNATFSRVDITGCDGIASAQHEDLAYLVRLNRFPVAMKAPVYMARWDNPGLYSLDVPYNASDVRTMNEDALGEIVAALEHNTVVRTVLLNQSCRGESCLRALLPVVERSPNLTKLSLQDNMLGDEGASLLVDAIRCNPATKLETIDLAGNELTDAGVAKFTEHLRTTEVIRAVRIDGNRNVSAVALAALQTAAAENNEPREVKAAFPALAGNDPRLAVLSLPGVPITNPRALSAPSRGYMTSLGATMIAGALETNSHVHTVDLRDNHIGPNGAKSLGLMLRRNPCVTSLDLSGNPIRDEGARHIVQGLARNDSIVVLRADRCSISIPLLTEIDDVCRVNVQPLPIKALYMTNPNTTNDALPGTIDLSHRPAEQPLGKNSTLDEETFLLMQHIMLRHRAQTVDTVDLADQPLGPAGVELLCEHWIERNVRIHTLKLSNTGLDDQCVARLLAAVRQNFVLRRIVVAGNLNVSVRASHALDAAVMLNQYPGYFKSAVPLLSGNVATLREVRLIHDGQRSSLKFGDDGAAVLCDALISNTHVTRVVMRGHGVTDRGFGFVVNLLQANPTLDTLDLRGNELGLDAATQLADLIERGRVQLADVDLGGNAIPDAGAFALLAALHKPTASALGLKRLDLAENPRVLPATLEALRVRLIELKQPLAFRAAFAKHGVLLPAARSKRPSLAGGGGQLGDSPAAALTPAASMTGDPSSEALPGAGDNDGVAHHDDSASAVPNTSLTPQSSMTTITTPTAAAGGGCPMLWDRTELAFSAADDAPLDDSAVEALLGILRLESAMVRAEALTARTRARPCKLERIALEGHPITDIGAAHVAAMLRLTPAIQAVSLAGCTGIVDVATIADFADVAATCDSLRTIDLEGCPVVSEADRVDGALSTLERLATACRANRQTPAFKEALKKAASVGPAFVQHVYLPHTDVDDDGLELFCQRLAKTNHPQQYTSNNNNTASVSVMQTTSPVALAGSSSRQLPSFTFGNLPQRPPSTAGSISGCRSPATTTAGMGNATASGAEVHLLSPSAALAASLRGGGGSRPPRLGGAVSGTPGGGGGGGATTLRSPSVVGFRTQSSGSLSPAHGGGDLDASVCGAGGFGQPLSYFDAEPATQHHLVPSAPPLSLLSRVDVSGNPKITDAGIAYLCQWLSAAAPNVQEFTCDGTSFTARGAQALKEYAWSHTSILLCSIEASAAPPLDDAGDRDANATSLEGARKSISERARDNQSQAATYRAQDEVEAKLADGMALPTMALPGGLGGRGEEDDEERRRRGAPDSPRELRREADDVLADALAAMPSRPRYARGQYRDGVESRLRGRKSTTATAVERATTAATPGWD